MTLGAGMGLEEAIGLDRLTPGNVDPHDLGAAASGHVAHAGPEDAVDADHDRIAALDHVDERCLHACGTGARDRQRHGVGGAEDGAQAGARVVEDVDECGIEVPEHRARQRLDGLGIGVAGPRSHEHAVGQRRHVRRDGSEGRRPAGKRPLSIDFASMRYSFAGAVIDTDTYELRAGERVVDVEPQVFDVLAHLIAHRERVRDQGGATRQHLGRSLRVGVGAHHADQTGTAGRRRRRSGATGDQDRARAWLPLRGADRRGRRVWRPTEADVGRAHAPGATDREAPLEPTPPTRYVANHGASIAYQTFGDGPDLVLIVGFTTNVEVQWEHPAIARFLRRLGSFCRVTVLDKKGQRPVRTCWAPTRYLRWSSEPTMCERSWMPPASTAPPLFGSSEGGVTRGAPGRRKPRSGRPLGPARHLGPPPLVPGSRPTRRRRGSNEPGAPAGCSLCSPRRWAPRRRDVGSSAAWNGRRQHPKPRDGCAELHVGHRRDGRPCERLGAHAGRPPHRRHHLRHRTRP